MTDYQQAQTAVEAAKYHYDYASLALDMAHIKERMAELEYQYMPLADFDKGNTEQRKRTLDAIFYVVVGRWPDGPVTTND